MVRVLVYHRIADPAATPWLDPTLVSATPGAFRRQMLHLKRRYRPVALSDLMGAFLGGRSLPRRAVHVTVDDAYRDFGEKAWPILRELGIPVTVFVPTAYPGEPARAFWWDRLHRATALGASVDGTSAGSREVRALLRYVPHDEAEAFVDRACSDVGLASYAPPERPPVLDWDELRVLAGEGVTFGAHTRNHVALSHVDEARMRAEIRASLQDLARELGDGPRALAYPYGICNPTVVRVAREEGCALGFTCEDGLNHPGRTDPHRLRRTNVTLRTSNPVFAVRMLPWFAGVDRWRHRGQRARTIR